MYQRLMMMNGLFDNTLWESPGGNDQPGFTPVLETDEEPTANSVARKWMVNFEQLRQSDFPHSDRSKNKQLAGATQDTPFPPRCPKLVHTYP